MLNILIMMNGQKKQSWQLTYNRSLNNVCSLGEISTVIKAKIIKIIKAAKDIKVIISNI